MKIILQNAKPFLSILEQQLSKTNKMVIIPILAVVILILLSGIRIAQEYQRGIVFRLGRFQSVRGPGIYWLIPFIEWQQKVDIRTKTVNLEQQETITKD